MNINNNFSYGKVSSNSDYADSAKLTDAGESSLNLSDLKSGSSFTGHVVSVNGNTVKLKLPGNNIVDAHISGAIDLKEGSDVTFEVRSSGNSLSISPLFTNLSNNPTISKALYAAGLPVNSDTMQMTNEMMKAGMGIDKTSLTSMFREIGTYSSYDAGSIVELHKLGINVTEENLSQLENYKNLSYKLEEGMQQVTADLNSLIDELNENGQVEKASTVFRTLISIGTGNENRDLVNAESVNSESADSNFVNLESVNADTGNKGLVNADNANKVSVSTGGKVIVSAEPETVPADYSEISSSFPLDSEAQSSESAFERAMRLLASVSDNNSGLSDYAVKEPSVFDGSNIDSVIRLIDDSLEKGDTDKLKSILSDQDLRKFVLDNVSSKWDIKPEDVSEKENVKELYARLQKDLGIIGKTLAETGTDSSQAAVSAGNMSSNLDFLNQVNHMYSFVQLPLKLSGGDNAHGDLYVYSNGKKMSGDDSKVTALLHLDMSNLGPLDVYVSLDTSGYDKKLSTNFTVADDSILDFLESHMDELNKRLEDKGYSCSTRMSVKDSSEADIKSEKLSGGAIGPVLDMTDSMKLSEYSFDVRT